MKNPAAFTLIEFIIFIGIMVFLLSFLWENQLPHKILMAAKINSLENDLHQITAATYNYLEKYHVLPGDLNNNGKIEGDFDSVKVNDESRLFWLQLRQASLIKGDSTDQQQPINPFGGIIGVTTGVVISKYHGISGLVIGFSHIPGEVASIIDSRHDDANSSLGHIQAQLILSGKETSTQNYSLKGLYNLYFAM